MAGTARRGRCKSRLACLTQTSLCLFISCSHEHFASSTTSVFFALVYAGVVLILFWSSLCPMQQPLLLQDRIFQEVRDDAMDAPTETAWCPRGRVATLACALAQQVVQGLSRRRDVPGDDAPRSAAVYSRPTMPVTTFGTSTLFNLMSYAGLITSWSIARLL